jgi:ATP-dependent DNA helicase RecQ
MSTTRERIDAVARDMYGWAQLKPAQAEAIDAVLGGRDVLAVMPTGYGKSAIYQVAAPLLDGPTLVVSPLIALQADQVRQITEARAAPEAVAVNSNQTRAQNSSAWEAVESGEAEFLFLAPEQLANDEVVAELTAVGVSMIVVDEAHCVSSWGHDFRPDYLRLGAFIEALGHPRVLALTATGSGPVREEIVERLGMREAQILVGGFDRPNIHLAVERHEQEHEQERAVLATVHDADKPGLVYVATRKDTERIADELGEAGLRAAAYHGGMGAKARREVHEAFLADAYDVVVATSAFGMGVDKPNVRFVVHGAITESLDEYYQEVGRGGRDGEPTRAVLHYRPEDLGLRAFFASGRPSSERVAAVAAALGRAREPIPMKALAAAAELPVRAVTAIVNLLVEGEAVRVGDDGVQVVGRLTASRADAIIDELAERRQRIDESRRAMIRAYAETERCRRNFLLEYFGAVTGDPCGNCDTCDRGTAYTAARAEAAAEVEALARETANGEQSVAAGGFTVDQLVRHTAWGEGRVMSVESDRITVFFDEEGYRVLSLALIEDEGLLEAV